MFRDQITYAVITEDRFRTTLPYFQESLHPRRTEYLGVHKGILYVVLVIKVFYM